MTCVCGHSRVDHHDTQMSVPLIGLDRYMPHGPRQIATTHPTATYEQQQCACGCTLFEPLPDDPGPAPRPVDCSLAYGL